jgi:hypothetical protein
MEEEVMVDTQISTTEINDSGGQKRKIGLAGAFIAFLLLFIVGTSFVVKKAADNKKEPTTIPEKNVSFGEGTLVYGYWASDSSVINALDLSSGKQLLLATLGKDIKHVRVSNNHTFFYINKTDAHDYGNELVTRDIEKNTDTQIIKADANFGIDDYVVSPSGEYAAVWEVGNNSQNTQFAGSPSRIYNVSTRSGMKHLIYDESSENGKTVHYPLAITDNGTLFTDRFLPNSGAGWGYGMSVSDFAGTDKKDIDTMKNGSYSTQPTISPDGQTFAFAGYSGTNGAEVVNGFRKALTMPDTLELFDVATMQRRKIPSGMSDAIFSALHWDNFSGELFFQAVQKKNGEVKTSTYSYSPRSNQIEKLPDVSQLDFLSSVGDRQFIAGQKFQDDSGVGNLGPSYTQSINKLYIVNTGTILQKALPIPQTPLQFISVLPSKYFPVVDKNGKSLVTSDQQLKLQTFDIKPTLAPKRLTQQSEPLPPPVNAPPAAPLPQCRDITYPQCNQLLGTNYSTSKDLSEINDKAFADCMWAAGAKVNDHCEDSPLYLYGKEGTRVNVTIDTKISNANVFFDKNTVNVVMGKDNRIIADDKLLDNISYDYVSKVKKLSPPDKGYILNPDNRREAENIATQIGLDEREVKDFADYVRTINSPFLFVSFFDQLTSQDILPLYIDPQPDVYRNIVFYIKKLNSMPVNLPLKPVIKPIVRYGFTAIEISYIVR